MTTIDEAAALLFDPWAGDMDSDAVTLRDTFVRARKGATCAICFGDIHVGDRVRAQTQRSAEERKVMTFRFCVDCCAAMVIVDHDFDAIEGRYTIGQKRARERRQATEI